MSRSFAAGHAFKQLAALKLMEGSGISALVRGARQEIPIVAERLSEIIDAMVAHGELSDG